MPLCMYSFINGFSILQSIVYSVITFKRLWKSEFSEVHVGVWLKVITGVMVFINILFMGVVVQALLPNLQMNEGLQQVVAFLSFELLMLLLIQ